MADSVSLLTAFRMEGAQLFFGLTASDGFVLAGGGALLAQGLTARPTQDLDFFTRPSGGDVRRARDEFIAAAGERGWPVDRVQDSETFCRLLVHGYEDLLVDLALDSAQGRGVVRSCGRARFLDVYALSRTFWKTEALELAREVDAGFVVGVFMDMIGYLARCRDGDLALDDVDVDAVRVFFRQWAAELSPIRSEPGRSTLLPSDLRVSGTME